MPDSESMDQALAKHKLNGLPSNETPTGKPLTPLPDGLSITVPEAQTLAERMHTLIVPDAFIDQAVKTGKALDQRGIVPAANGYSLMTIQAAMTMLQALTSEVKDAKTAAKYAKPVCMVMKQVRDFTKDMRASGGGVVLEEKEVNPKKKNVFPAGQIIQATVLPSTPTESVDGKPL